MRALTLIILIFCFHTAFALLNAANEISPIFYFTVAEQVEANSMVTSEANSQYTPGGVQNAQISLGFGDIVFSLFHFITVMATTIVLPAYYLVAFGVPVAIALIVNGLLLFIYVLGILQIIRGSATGGMQ